MSAPRRPIVGRAWLTLTVLPSLVNCQAADGDATAVIVRDDGALRARASACLGLNGTQSVTLFWPPAIEGGADDGTTLRACVAGAESCAEVQSCVGYEAGPCEADRCEAGVALRCRRLATGQTVIEHEHCDPSSENAACSVVDDVKEGRIAFCHAGACASDHCDGDVLVRCRSGLSMRTDCAAAGRFCRELSGAAFCALPEPCVVDHCDGEVATLCHGGYVEHRERCDALVPGSSCVDVSGGVECRTAVNEPRCDAWGEFASWCEGTSAWTCLGGAAFELDCAALSGGACHSELIGNAGSESRAGCTASDL
jgi:hypothetical protein